ncbi:hypothetical protein [Bradyrhizobium sp. LA7.1]|uniref:hypothetical protein n=1 Tax=Bradyrhizobium sp. LA7.1 TaxID=3156324 RepID=UPI0033984861
MTTFDPSQTEDLAVYEAHFMGTLKSTLTTVFDADPTLASRYWSDLREAPPLQRALALHDDPLDVASTLTGQFLTADRIALYDAMVVPSPEVKRIVRDAPEFIPREDILSSAPRDERAPLVAVATLNKFMGELGYQRLAVSSGVAYYRLERRAWKRPLLKQIVMETLPGLTEDREEVYRLDRILNMLNGLQEFARQRKPDSSIVMRVQKTKERLLRALGIN